MFAGVQTIEALGPNPASYFISTYPVEISYLHPKEAEELIRNPDPDAGAMPKFEDVVVAKILEQTLCQPFLVQFVCSEIINLANEQNLETITLDVLDSAIEKTLSLTLYFNNIWEDSGKAGQELLAYLANHSTDLSTRETDEQLLLILQQKHVIKKLNNNEYLIEIPLVKEWIRRQTLPTF